MNKGALTFFCGKMGAGKFAEASEVAQKSNAVLLPEDEWFASLYPNKTSSLNDYVEYLNLAGVGRTCTGATARLEPGRYT
ncbi:ATP-binding protein [Halopseudomonas maritima]|uniref:ATP-binding protein n=1 Tax=Halopseudomonas maritima TaxID=2918528 RepID=UPI001EEAC16D|nr:ATP-binding protein [Halopseudomonas maritima]UJJ33154.1 ATP-binding protein [Halopseudomonas maritima]